MTNSLKNYKSHVEGKNEETVTDVLYEDMGMYEDVDGINIITDARHGWRKNSNDTSVVSTSQKIDDEVIPMYCNPCC